PTKQQQHKSILKNNNQKLKEKASTSLNNNNKRVHIKDSGSSSDSGMNEFKAKLSRSDEKIE
ncbi:5880_t:CDS:1, partial [Rhizophagus irregularis]